MSRIPFIAQQPVDDLPLMLPFCLIGTIQLRYWHAFLSCGHGTLILRSRK